MTLDDLGKKLLGSHNWQGKEAILSEIKGILAPCSDGALDSIWESYSREWIHAYVPRPAHFIGWKASSQSGMFNSKIPLWKCDCGALYSLRSSGCPACKGKITHGVVLADSSSHFIECQPDCFQCERFGKANSFGPSCAYWGEEPPKSLDCSKCICSYCCGIEKDFKENPHKYKGNQIQIEDFLKYKEA